MKLDRIYSKKQLKTKGSETNVNNKQNEQIKQIAASDGTRFRDSLKVRKVQLDTVQLNQQYHDHFMKDESITDSLNTQDYKGKESGKNRTLELLNSFVNNDDLKDQDFLSLYEAQAYEQIVNNFSSLNLYVKDRQEIENEKEKEKGS